MGVHFCANLVLQAVKHEAHNPVTSIQNSWDDQDQDHQDDPELIFSWTLLKNCFKAAYSQIEDTFNNT